MDRSQVASVQPAMRLADFGGAAAPLEAIAPADFSEVLVATTWGCNLACSYCFVQTRGLSTEGANMSPELAGLLVDVLDEGLRDVETIGIHLYGGEPLTNLSALRALLDRVGNKPKGRFQFSITTNGTVLEPEVFELLDLGRFQVILSIDGPQEIHDRCRRTPSRQPTHHRVLRFLQMLRTRTRCGVRGSAVVRSGWSLAEAERYLAGLEVDAIKAQAVRLPAGHRWALGRSEWDAYLTHLEQIGDRVIRDLERGRVPRDDRYSSRVLQLLKGVRRPLYCAAGMTNFGVTPDGQVLPCVLLEPEEHQLGCLTDEPSSWRAAGRAWAEAQSPGPECAKCEALALCGGGCPAIGPVCGKEECAVVRKNCEVAKRIFDHFRDDPTALLTLAGIDPAN